MKVEELAGHGLSERAIGVLRKRGIQELNPVQEEAVKKGLLRGANIVVSSPTASGKTLIGELGLVKAVEDGGMGMYLVPLRALASEIHGTLSTWGELGFRVGITTGDYESPGEHLGRYDIVVATYERFDSLLRLKPWWLRRVRTVVVDEMHIISDPHRGPVLEMIMARLLGMGVQVIGLSATIGNPWMLAEWLGAELVESNWRPVQLVEGAYDPRRRLIVFSDGRRERVGKRVYNNAVTLALHSIQQGHQVLVFVSNRKRAETWAAKLAEHLAGQRTLDAGRRGELVEELRGSAASRGEYEKLAPLIEQGVAFHHAGLSMGARRVVEKGFRERLITAVFATPTLAAGVNLPARRVLVAIKRYDPVRGYSVGIPVFEYKQMAGRAGRPRYDPYGESIIYDARSLEEAKRYIEGRPEPVESKLGNRRSLRIHVLAIIAGGEASGLDGLMEVFEKTLLYKQYRSRRYIENMIREIAGWLRRKGFIEEEGSVYTATRLGWITMATYLDPLSAATYLEMASETPEPGVLWLLHAAAMTPDYARSRPYISGSIIDLYEEEAWSLSDEGAVPPPPSDDYEYDNWLKAYVHARMLSDWINEEPEDRIMEKYGVGPGDIYSAKETMAWITGALSRVAAVQGLDTHSERLSRLSVRLEHGVREDALELIRIKGIGRARARLLIKAGITSLEKLASAKPEQLTRIPGIGPGLARSFIEQARALLAGKTASASP